MSSNKPKDYTTVPRSSLPHSPVLRPSEVFGLEVDDLRRTVTVRQQLLTSAVRANMPVRAENPVHGCEQRSCDASGPPVMITDHVPAVCFPSDHADGRVAAAGPT
jgi:hypothetical protein